MDLSLADLVLQISLALVAITVALNSKGAVRSSFSGLFAAVVVGLTGVIIMLYFNAGPLSPPSPTQQSGNGDSLSLEGNGEEVTEAMKAPQRIRHEEAVVREQQQLAAESTTVDIRSYREQVKPVVESAKKWCAAVGEFPMNGIDTLDDVGINLRKSRALELRLEANKIADGVMTIRPPNGVSNTHQSLIGAAEHLRQTGVKLVRLTATQNGEEEKGAETGVRNSLRAAQRSLENFTQAAGL